MGQKVAAHLNDLEAAKRCGFQTVYVERAQEEDWTPDAVAKAKSDAWVDLWVTRDEKGFVTLAEKLGVHGVRGG